MRFLLFSFLFLISFLSWGGCADINAAAENEQVLIPSYESGYVVSDRERVYFYSAPDESCKIKDVFIVNGDFVNSYADYQGFTSVMYFKKNGDVVNGWVHSKSLKPTGTGVGPSEQ